LIIFTNVAAKRFLFNTTFWRQDVPSQRHTQRQNVFGVQIVASSCPASFFLRCKNWETWKEFKQNFLGIEI